MRIFLTIVLSVLCFSAGAQTDQDIVGTWKFKKWEVSKKEAGKKIKSEERWSPYIITLNSDNTFTNVTLSYPDEQEVVIRGNWKISDGKIQLKFSDSSGLAMSTVKGQQFVISKVNRKRLILLFEDAYNLKSEGGKWMDVSVTYQRYRE